VEDPEASETAPRGAARRAALVQAALRVLAQRGPDGLTHRLVATEAGVPLAASTYWFRSKEDLVEAAFACAVDEGVADLEAIRRDAPRWTRAGAAARVARGIEEECAARRESTVVGYALWVEAGRRPALRPLAQRWADAYVEHYAAVLAAIGWTGDPRTRARLISAAVDGLVGQQLAAEAPLGRAALTRILAPLFEDAA
jgi:DNA-binding transcriptional regulator YbjK